MKPLIILSLLSSLAFAAPPKDPRVDAAKKAAADLTQQYLQSPHKVTLLKTSIVEQANDFFLVSVTVNMNHGVAKYIPGITATPHIVRVSNHRTTANFCLIIQVSSIVGEDGKPTTEVSYIENNNDVPNVYIQECGTDELEHFKLVNNWPTTTN